MFKEQKKQNPNKGITLIALVITIIVMFENVPYIAVAGMSWRQFNRI